MDKAMRDVDKLLQMVRGIRVCVGGEGGRGAGDKLLQMVRGAGG